MTNRETNYLEMAKRTLAVLKKHIQKFTGKAAVLNFITDFDTSVNKVEETNLGYKNATKGKASAKSSAVEELIFALLPIKGALFAHASKTKNYELKAIANISESELHRMRKSEMVEKATAIEQAALANTAALNEAGTSDELFATLHIKIASYDSLNEEKETSMTSRSSLRQALTTDFDELELLLNEQGDALIELVRKDYPDVYNEYFAARVIKDLGGSHNKGNGEEDDTQTPQNPPTP